MCEDHWSQRTIDQSQWPESIPHSGLPIGEVTLIKERRLIGRVSLYHKDCMLEHGLPFYLKTVSLNHQEPRFDTTCCPRIKAKPKRGVNWVIKVSDHIKLITLFHNIKELFLIILLRLLL